LDGARETRADEVPVDDGRGRRGRAELVSAAGYGAGIARIIRAVAAGVPLPTLLGFVIVAILVLTTDG
jgi:hypothetical protein